MVAALLSITGGGVYLGAAVVARHRAQAAADLAALAAAGKLLWQPGAACAEADRIAGAQHARMLSCAVQTDGGEDAPGTELQSQQVETDTVPCTTLDELSGQLRAERRAAAWSRSASPRASPTWSPSR